MDTEKREEAFTKHQARMRERLETDASRLNDLKVGLEVAIQNPQAGGKPGRWSKSGTVIEKLDYNSYQVRVHGNRNLTTQNR